MILRRSVVTGLLLGPLWLGSARRGLAATRRIVTLGGAITETVWALGAGSEVVATDVSSLYPIEATRLPQVGYYRQISAEGVLSVSPTLVLTTEEAGPEAAFTQVQSAGIAVVKVPAVRDPEAAVARVSTIARALGVSDEPLRSAVAADFAEAAKKVARQTRRPRVLFVLARGSGVATVAGTDTAADTMITLAGGLNAAAALSGYRPLTPEAALAAAPDVVLVTTMGLDALGGATGLWALPGLGLTPAGQKQRLLVHEDLPLLGFGPRSGRTLSALADELGAG